METFIGLVAQTIRTDYPNPERIALVFPSRRAAVFFRDEYLRQAGKAAFSPEIFAFEDFVREWSGATFADPVSQAFELYPIYREFFPEHPFEKYFSWGMALVGDFDEVDRYLVDADAIFRNMFELKEIDVTIESWLNEDRQPTEFQARYLRFWESMGEMYRRLRKKMEIRGLSAPGLALRRLAEQLDTEVPPMRWEQVVFAGFNALSPAEEKLIFGLAEAGKARCLWDYDRYYTENAHQEAGMFYREMRSRHPAGLQDWLSERLSTEAKEVVITSAPRQAAQAKAAGIRLGELLAGGAVPERTAVVLPDEGLLFPVLHSLPPEAKDINVTMGLPLRLTPLFGLSESLLTLHENAEITHKGEGRRYFFRDVRQIIRHPFIQLISGQDARGLFREIGRQNMVYLSTTWLEKRFEEDHFFRFLFQPWLSVPEAIEFYLELYRRLRAALDPAGKGPVPVELDYVYQLYTITQRFRDKISDLAPDLDPSSFRRLYREVMQGARVPFTGEPLKGIQIMGMLETRSLDFENLVILSVNEGILPSAAERSSFIPYNLRRAFGLPLPEEKEAVMAYHFYRLLQRAKRIHLIYNSDTEGYGLAEKSRFITQLEAEWLLANPLVSLKEEVMSLPLRREEVRPVLAAKTREVLDELKMYAGERGFTPTMLNTYLHCSLQFHFRYVMHLKEEDSPEQSMEAHTFGKVAHGLLEVLYEPYVGKEVQVADIGEMKSRIPEVLPAVFKEVTYSGNPDKGRNHLLLRVIEQLCGELLDKDAAEAPFELIGLEERREAEFDLVAHKLKVKFYGVLDRVDRRKGMTRIIDYKTGRVNPRALSLDSLEEMQESKKKEGLQLATYAWLYLKSEGVPGPVQAGIYALRNLSAGLQWLDPAAGGADTVDAESLSAYESLVGSLLHELFDSEIPFRQTEDEDRCRFCAYRVMCVRD